MIVWKDRFVLGVQEIDEQHQHLVGLLNQAYDNFIAGAPSESVESLLKELIDYSTYHFEAEESWMHEQSYPMQSEQHARNARFADLIVDMLKVHQVDRRYHLKELLIFLKDWLTDHILMSVADYGRYSSAIRK